MNTTTEPVLILASASPRRRELLGQHGYCFRIAEPNHLEPVTDVLRVEPCQVAEANAYFKARSVADAGERGLILGADTIVVYQDRIFGKPENAEDARFIISTLAGTEHAVITGIALLDTASYHRRIRHDRTGVRMRPMPPDVLDEYIASRAWEGKAGAYGIQDHGDAFIEYIEGSFSNVVGLPMELLADTLAQMGYSELVDRARIQAHGDM